MSIIDIPSEIESWQPVIASVSGGKDSTAVILALREADMPARYVYADTGWESPEVYDYLDMLRARLDITIDVVRGKLSMVEHIIAEARFPSRGQKWCTRDLKIKPLRAYHDRVADELDIDPGATVSVLGIRAEESAKRALMQPWGYDERWRGYVWRPILDWTIGDVLAMHRRHGVPVNPLYQRGFDRVGCFPCIYANKGEIRLMAEIAPERIDLVRRLEQQVSEERAIRNRETPGRYPVERASFFCAEQRGLPDIDAVVEWSRTEHGGRQYPLFDAPPRGGCMRWGLCEHPEANKEQP